MNVMRRWIIGAWTAGLLAPFDQVHTCRLHGRLPGYLTLIDDY
jgi:hypothetical protein